MQGKDARRDRTNKTTRGREDVRVIEEIKGEDRMAAVESRITKAKGVLDRVVK